MKVICAEEQCVGCFACYNACPKKCIEMRVDKEGFKYPEIDGKLCIDCGKCKSVCPVVNNSKTSIADPKVFGGYSIDQNVRKSSSSGGAFLTFARDFIIKGGGIVFGAAFSEDYYSVNITSVDNPTDLWKLSGSKYLQSNIGDSYRQAKELLENGKKVLFSGSPCQIAGLKCYLKKEYENLLTIDFICHGVPSPLVWEGYLKELESKYNSKAIEISFRSKAINWQFYSLQIKFENGQEYLQNLNEDVYMQGFLKNLYLRNSCYKCQFKEPNFASDITIGDFWGVGNINPQIDTEKGVSCFVIRSEKGNSYFEKVSEDLKIFDCDIHVLFDLNSAIKNSVHMNIDRTKFFKVKTNNVSNRINKFLIRNPKQIKRKLFREDIAMVKEEKGKMYSMLYAIKHFYKIF